MDGPDMDDESDESMNKRIELLDKCMRFMEKPEAVVTSGDGKGDGKFTPRWRPVNVQKIFSTGCRSACVEYEIDGTCGQRLVAEEGSVKFVTESMKTLNGKAPPPIVKHFDDDNSTEPASRAKTDEADDAVDAPRRHQGTSDECYICFDRAMNSVLLPCGHSGTCYECAIENVARCESCPCCRHSVNQVVVYDPMSRTRRPDGTTSFPVIGPGALN